jgi:hypothetical protein
MYGDFGPEWFWRFLFFCAIAGFFALIGFAIWGVIWIFNHIRFE